MNGSQGTLSESSTENINYLFKILVIGSGGAGKTCIVKRYVHNFFNENARATIGVDFALKVINWDSHTVVRVQLWDIAGQESFANMTRVYYREAVGAIIVFDCTKTESFNSVLKWKDDLDNKLKLPNGKSVPAILLANKADLLQSDADLAITPKILSEFCEKHGFLGWFKTSAKENLNISDSIRELLEQVIVDEKELNENNDGATSGDASLIRLRDIDSPDSTLNASGDKGGFCRC